MSDVDVVRRLLALERRIERLETTGTGYQVGVWTPTYLGAATPGATTYTTQVGVYTRSGNLIAFSAHVAWTAATGTGVAIVSLPFTSDATTDQRWAVAVQSANVTFANGSIQGVIVPNVAYVQFISPATNAAGTQLTVEAAGTLVVSGVYSI